MLFKLELDLSWTVLQKSCLPKPIFKIKISEILVLF